MKKIITLLALVVSLPTFAQWHLLPRVPNCITYNGFGNPIIQCPTSLIIAGDGHILYSDYAYYSPSTGSQTDIYESHDDLSSATGKYYNIGGLPYPTAKILGSGNNSSFMFYVSNIGELYTKNDFSIYNGVSFCSGSGSTLTNFQLTNSYIYFYGQSSATDTLVISRIPNTVLSPNLCNKLYAYNGQSGLMQFLNDSVGYLLCSYRSNLVKKVLLKTINYGTTWSEVYLDSLLGITSFNFPTANVGYILNNDGSITKTLNGGTSWASISPPIANYIHMAFSTDSIGYVAGHAGFLTRTADGGNTWTTQISGTTYPIYSLYAFPGDVAYFKDSVQNIYKNKPLTTSIKAYINLTETNIYPNPNNGSFFIETNNNAKQTLQIFDVNGKLVLSQTINGKTNIDASNLAEGVYNLNLINSSGAINKRLVIVK